jgi:uncharacterized membrane protein HdeD (DUF308 family)
MTSFSLKNYRGQQLFFAGLCFVLALMSLWALFREAPVPERVGVLLIWSAIFVFMQSFSRATDRDRSAGRRSGIVTLILGIVLINAPFLAASAVVIFFAFILGLEAFRQLSAMLVKKREGKNYIWELLSFIGDILVLLTMFLLQEKGVDFMLAVGSALRIAGMGIEILKAKMGVMTDVGGDVVDSLGLPDQPEIREIAERIETEETVRAPIDRGWIFSFLFILFFIHLGRMGYDRSGTGLLSVTVALIGDIAVALIASYFIIMPLRGVFRGVTRPLERKLWSWVLTASSEEKKKWYSLKGITRRWLEYRLRLSVRIRKSGYSLATAFRSGLQTGLPFAALLAAIIPVFGMSWYFDTENWASGIWDGWAAERADTWREAMVRSIDEHPSASSFRLRPAGMDDSSAFSFVVVGDPGEGDASQLILHDQIVRQTNKPDVRFLVISSDVVYPDGEMKDYEKNFWLPMKGITKPVYAIPGNHDWYDALEGFAATFYTPEAARKSMIGRKQAFLKLPLANTRKMDEKIAEATRLRSLYQVPTGFQTTPFFQVQTRDFAFISIETGVLRKIDTVQMSWLKQVLEASKGKFIFALLGHPFYAIGEYQGIMNPDFERLHALLRSHGARVVMAGDTHDLEYYLEPADSVGGEVHHFVNGGGGAYLSIGAALKPKDQMPEKVWAHYPAKEPLVAKIEKHNQLVKKPFWYWTKQYNGWPFSAEWLSAAFDYNKAPFFQSFMEVKVDPAKNEVRLIAYGVNGPLTWGEMEMSEGVKPAGKQASDPVQWVFPLK